MWVGNFTQWAFKITEDNGKDGEEKFYPRAEVFIRKRKEFNEDLLEIFLMFIIIFYVVEDLLINSNLWEKSILDDFCDF